MTIPFDFMATRAERPALADRGSAVRDRGPRENAFPDAFRSAVDAGSRGRDRAEQARSSVDDPATRPAGRPHRPDRPGDDRSVNAADRARQRGDEQRAERSTDGGRRPEQADSAAQAAVLTALRANGLSSDAVRSVAALLGDATATDGELAPTDEDVEVVGATDEEAALLSDLEAIAGAIETTEMSAADLEALLAAAGTDAERTAAVAAQAAATVVATDTDTTAAPADGARHGQGHGPSATGATGLARAAEVAADGARVHQLDAVAEDTVPGQRPVAQVLSAAERALARSAGTTETTETVRPPVSAVSGEPAPIQGLALGRIPTDRGATPGAASVQRVLDALELLEQAPPPRQITLELGDARVRVALDDGQVRLSVVGPGNDAVERWLEETRAALAQHGFDLGQQQGERTEEQTDGEQPRPLAGVGADGGADGDARSGAVRDDAGALRL